MVLGRMVLRIICGELLWPGQCSYCESVMIIQYVLVLLLCAASGAVISMERSKRREIERRQRFLQRVRIALGVSEPGT